MDKSKIFIKHNRRPSISFYNKYLINSIDLSRDNNNINDSFNYLYKTNNNPLLKTKEYNKSKKELILAKLDTSYLPKKKRTKIEEKNIINKTVNYDDDSEGIIMAAKLSTTFMTYKDKNDSNIYYPKKKIRNKNEYDNCYNNITKEKSSYISDNDIFDISPLEKYNRQIDVILKVQSKWRSYYIRKKYITKMKSNKFVKLIVKKIYKEVFNKILYFSINKEKIYYKKIPEKNKNEKVVKNNTFQNDMLQIEEKINELTILDNKFDKKNSKKRTVEEKYYNKNYWIQFPFSLEKYIKKQNILLYSNLFLEQMRIISNKKLKEKQMIFLKKLISLNETRNVKKYMRKYKEIILIERTKQYIYHSLVKKKPKLKAKPNNNFNFQYFYKQNILRDIIKKYRYTSVVQKHYFLWKKKSKPNNKIVENKKKRFIKVRRIKKKEEEQNKDNNTWKKDDPMKNVSGIESTNNCLNSNSNISNSNQSIKNIQGCLTLINKKMKIRKLTVDHKYYEYVENSNNNYLNYK